MKHYLVNQLISDPVLLIEAALSVLMYFCTLCTQTVTYMCYHAPPLCRNKLIITLLCSIALHFPLRCQSIHFCVTLLNITAIFDFMNVFLKYMDRFEISSFCIIVQMTLNECKSQAMGVFAPKLHFV